MNQQLFPHFFTFSVQNRNMTTLILSNICGLGVHGARIFSPHIVPTNFYLLHYKRLSSEDIISFALLLSMILVFLCFLQKIINLQESEMIQDGQTGNCDALFAVCLTIQVQFPFNKMMHLYHSENVSILIAILMLKSRSGPYSSLPWSIWNVFDRN